MFSKQTITNKINRNQQRLHLHLWITQVLLHCVTQSKDNEEKKKTKFFSEDRSTVIPDTARKNRSIQGPFWVISVFRGTFWASSWCVGATEEGFVCQLSKLPPPKCLKVPACSGNRDPHLLMMNPGWSWPPPELQTPPFITGNHSEPGEIILSTLLQYCLCISKPNSHRSPETTTAQWPGRELSPLTRDKAAQSKLV